MVCKKVTSFETNDFLKFKYIIVEKKKIVIDARFWPNLLADSWFKKWLELRIVSRAFMCRPLFRKRHINIHKYEKFIPSSSEQLCTTDAIHEPACISRRRCRLRWSSRFALISSSLFCTPARLRLAALWCCFVDAVTWVVNVDYMSTRSNRLSDERRRKKETNLKKKSYLKVKLSSSEVFFMYFLSVVAVLDTSIFCHNYKHSVWVNWSMDTCVF